jgi:hypothetical protein
MSNDVSPKYDRHAEGTRFLMLCHCAKGSIGRKVEEHKMMKAATAFLLILASLSFVSEANAVVCARGVVRAGCAGPNGAVVARRPVAPVVRPVCTIVNGVRVCR